MLYILLGCFAFMFLYIFDLNKLYNIHPVLNSFFALGVLLLSGSTLGILFTDSVKFETGTAFKVFFSMLALVAFILMIYSLFFALPFKKTYVEMKEIKLIDTGMWALCRHVGVFWFFFLYLFLWLASGKILMFIAGVIWTSLDVIHVYIQDRWIFPQTIPEYDKYKLQVPFLIPNKASISRCLSSIGCK